LPKNKSFLKVRFAHNLKKSSKILSRRNLIQNKKSLKMTHMFSAEELEKLSPKERLALASREIRNLLHDQASNIGAVIGFLQFTSIEMHPVNHEHAKEYVSKANAAAVKAAEKSSEIRDIILNIIDISIREIKEQP
jgi:hypothetical protein